MLMRTRVSRFVNRYLLFGRYETICSRVYRYEWRMAVSIINLLFRDAHHCREAYEEDYPMLVCMTCGCIRQKRKFYCSEACEEAGRLNADYLLTDPQVVVRRDGGWHEDMPELQDSA